MKKITLTIFLFFFTIAVFPQSNTEETVNKYIKKLELKVLLTADQKSTITSYFNSKMGELKNPSAKGKAIQDLKGKVESVLDKKQADKYAIIKDDFWSYLDKDLK